MSISFAQPKPAIKKFKGAKKTHMHKDIKMETILGPNS